MGMYIFETKKALQHFLSEKRSQKKSIGFVATMGALHKGHLSLIKKAQKKNAVVVASIFVNPTQFDNKEDLDQYPKPLSQDISLLESVNCDVLFCPSASEIYGEDLNADAFDFDGLDKVMEGAFRKGHFNGVGTIVKKLFEIVNPDVAYFGEKDFQQLQVIKKMVKKNKLPVRIKGCKILREKDGLAMSSRNGRLTEVHRKEASFIYQKLKKVVELFASKSIAEINDWVVNEFEKNSLLQLEYFTIANEKTLTPALKKSSHQKQRAFIAVFAGNIRLIDNVKLK